MRVASLHRYVLLLVFCTFILIVEGALTTSKAGQVYRTGHRHLAYALGVAFLVLAIWTARSGVPAGLKILTFWPVFAMIPAPPVVHALLAQGVFSTLAVAALLTSRSWQNAEKTVEDTATPSLRSVTLAVPVIMFGQIALGAAFRHGAIGGIPHIAGAMLSLGAALLAGIFTLSQHSSHPALRQAAIVLLSLTLIQVFLGLGAFITKGSGDGSAVLLAVSHVATGTLTFASSILLALQVVHNVRRITIVRVTSRSAAATS